MTSSRGQPADAALYHRVRWFLGLRDLVVTFRTRRCQYGCSFCDLPRRSATHDVEAALIEAQANAVFNLYRDRGDTVQQLSLGNEGSILDGTRFPASALCAVVDWVRRFGDVRYLSLETRPEFVTDRSLDTMQARAGVNLDVTVGLETLDDRLRNDVLRKQMPLTTFELAAAVAGRRGVRLTTYVLLKPLPDMDERAAVADARRTVQYLATLRDAHRVDVVVYLNPLYVTPRLAARYGPAAAPPTIEMVLSVAREIVGYGLPMHLGLWSEGLAVRGGDIEAYGRSKPWLWRRLVDFARHQDFARVDVQVPSGEIEDRPST